MIAISFRFGILLTVILWLLVRGVLAIRNGKVHWLREAKELLFLINLLVIVRIAFYPMETLDGKVQPLLFEAAAAWPFRLNLIPFVHLLDYESKREMVLNFVGNSMLFLPTGILLPILYQKLDTFRKVTLTGFVMSLLIELIQLPFAVRCSDVDDLILNTLGCMAGYGIYRLVKGIRLCRKTS